jgi:SseB protein N-terminal domain/SseB protein C-terminal domain
MNDVNPQPEKNAQGPEEIENPELVRAMHAVATNDNAENRKQLYTAMLGAILLIPVPEVPPELRPGLQTAGQGFQLRVASFLDANQIPITVGFTDVEALRNWNPNTLYIGLKAADLFRFLLGTNIQDLVINPVGPDQKMIRPGGRVKRAEIEQLANGVMPGGDRLQQMQFKTEERVLIGLPANSPSGEIQDALRNKAAEMSTIAALYFFQMARKDGESNTVIGIDLNTTAQDGQQPEIAHAMGEAIRGKLKPNERLDFMFLGGSFGEQIRKIGKMIFYRP